MTSWFWASKPTTSDFAGGPPTASSAPTEFSPQAATAAQAPPVSPPAPAPSAPAYADPENFAPQTFSDLEFDSVLDITERIGYLKQLGLDYGWGPTSMIEWVLEHVYIYSGMPWWAAIATVAIGFRLVMFVPTMRAQRASALIQAVRQTPEFKAAEAKMRAASHGTDQADILQARMAMTQLMRKSGGSTLRAFLPAVVMLPFSFCMFRLLRSMALLPVPSLETGGMLWFVDMSVADPFYILPLTSAVLSGYMFTLQQKGNGAQTPSTQAMSKLLMYALTPLAFIGTSWMPAAVQWFFLCFSGASVMQAQAALNPGVRSHFQLPPLPETPTLSSASSNATFGGASANWQAPAKGSLGLRGMLENAEKEVKKVSTGASEMVSKTGFSTSTEAEKQKKYEEKRKSEDRQKALRRFQEENRKRLQEQHKRH